MPVTTYYAYDLRAREITAELPLGRVAWSRDLKRPGVFRGDLPLKASDAVNRAWVQATQPKRAGLVVDRDGVPVWAGVIWKRDYDTTTQVMTLGAGGFLSYLHRLAITSTLTFTGTDQFAIARTLLDAAQAKAGADLGITATAGSSGVLRDRTYWGYEAKPVGEALTQLSDVISGFDFDFDLAWGGATGRRLDVNLTLSYPRRGRRAETNNLVFEIGRNAQLLSWPEDTSEAADVVYAVGAGEGDDMLRFTASDLSLVDAGYLRTERTITHKDVTILGTLQGHAQAELAARRQTGVSTPKLSTQGDREPEVGSWILGDECTVRIQAGDDVRFPDGIERFYRILGYDVDVDDNGAERVTLQLGEL